MTRTRGRPRKTDDLATRDRLLAAATEACVDAGFDAVTVANVAERAGVTPAAVYNHFADKSDLLYTAGRLAIARLNTAIAPTGDPAQAAHDVVDAFLRPSFRSSRRLILELHIASSRHPELAERLAEWHQEFAALAVQHSPEEPEAVLVEVKALFLLLLGCCHLEDLDALSTSPAALHELLGHLVDALYRTPR